MTLFLLPHRRRPRSRSCHRCTSTPGAPGSRRACTTSVHSPPQKRSSSQCASRRKSARPAAGATTRRMRTRARPRSRAPSGLVARTARRAAARRDEPAVVVSGGVVWPALVQALALTRDCGVDEASERESCVIVDEDECACR